MDRTIAFGAVARHRRGVGRYRRTFAHVAFRQISRLAGVARFSQRNFVRSALTSPLTNPKCSKRSTIELVLLERTSVIIGVLPSFNFDMREEEPDRLADMGNHCTLLQTAKMNDVDPLTWLAQTLQRIANGWPISQIEKLMPWNYKA